MACSCGSTPGKIIQTDEGSNICQCDDGISVCIDTSQGFYDDLSQVIPPLYQLIILGVVLISIALYIVGGVFFSKITDHPRNNVKDYTLSLSFTIFGAFVPLFMLFNPIYYATVTLKR